MDISVGEFKEFKSGHLVGFCSVTFDGKLKIAECRIFEKAGRRWLGWPQMRSLGRDGAVTYYDIIVFDKGYHAAVQDALRPRIDAILKGGPSYATEAEVQPQAPRRSPVRSGGHSPGPAGDRDYQNSRKASEDPAGKDVPW